MKNTEKPNRLKKDIYILPDYLTHSEKEVWATFLQGKYRLFLFELPGHKKNEKGQNYSQFLNSIEKKVLEDPNPIAIVSTGFTSALALELAYKYPKKIVQCILISPVLTESRLKQALLKIKNILNWLQNEKIRLFSVYAIFKSRNLFIRLTNTISFLKNLNFNTKVVFILSAKKSYLNDFQTKDSLRISKNPEVVRFRYSSTKVNKNDWRFKKLIFEILNQK
ncbi:MAG: hypothetical protein L6Q54_09310 [Leptospiraceae bacterium]|nr:hypothetical protein [Leptospiraceae bacterium]MCK6381426.1 hypothetical protein [Leptospiraceae bacterium]